MRTAARDAAPQRGLPVVAVGAGFPALQQPAPPRLVFLEGVGERAGERPVPDRVARCQEAGKVRRRRGAQFMQQMPAQHVGS
ncbi:MAG TPA: hypothetical protein VFT98_20100, partial [Myxococcota bacterium]|nr:hypothetical protein [Myxococcota bacterium]